MHLAELLKLASENGVVAFIIGLIVAIGLYYFVKLVLVLVKKVETSSEVINNLGKALTNDKGEPISQVDHFNQVTKFLEEIKKIELYHHEEAKKHYKDTEIIADENKVKNCDAQNCPYLLKMVAEVKNFTTRFNEFEKKAHDSRTTSGASLEDIRQQMQLLASEVSQQSKQMVNVLTDILIGRKNK
jgi:hypothetical protein